MNYYWVCIGKHWYVWVVVSCIFIVICVFVCGCVTNWRKLILNHFAMPMYLSRPTNRAPDFRTTVKNSKCVFFSVIRYYRAHYFALWRICLRISPSSNDNLPQVISKRTVQIWWPWRCCICKKWIRVGRLWAFSWVDEAHLPPVCCSWTSTVLLLIDGHKSHLTLECIDLARKNQVILLCVPPHTTHALQPLDVAVFKALKAYFSQALRVCCFTKIELHCVQTWFRSYCEGAIRVCFFYGEH